MYRITHRIKLSKKKINIQNPPNHHPARITKSDKDFVKKLDFKDIKFPAKVREIHEIEKKNCINISVFSYENKEKQPIYVSKKCVLFIGEKWKLHYVLITDFKTLMYNHTLHYREKTFLSILFTSI